MGNLTVKKAKLKDRYMELEMEEQVKTADGNTAMNEIIKKCNVLVHEDLIKAMEALTFHMVVIAGQKGDDFLKVVGPMDAQCAEHLKDFCCTGYSIGGHDEYMGVTLIGYKKFTSGKKLNLCTPFTRYMDENDPYKYSIELEEAICQVEYEIMQYVSGKKTGCNVQLDLFQQPVTLEEAIINMQPDYSITGITPDGEISTLSGDEFYVKLQKVAEE